MAKDKKHKAKDKKDKKDKKHKNKSLHKSHGEYPPASLAAIHWLAMEIEQAALCVYITDPDQFDKVEKPMRELIKALRANKALATVEDGDCPDGWLECNGMCTPICSN